MKGKVQSAPYELLVVANKDWLKTEAGQKLVEIVEAPISGLPQREGNSRSLQGGVSVLCQHLGGESGHET